VAACDAAAVDARCGPVQYGYRDEAAAMRNTSAHSVCTALLFFAYIKTSES
jgi:hypothetical protein